MLGDDCNSNRGLEKVRIIHWLPLTDQNRIIALTSAPGQNSEL